MNENPYETPKSKGGRASVMLSEKRLTLSSLFKLLFIGFLFSLGPIFMASGIYALITGGESMVEFNNEKLRGLAGFIGSIIFIPIMSFLLSGLVWLFVGFGTWLYTRFWKMNINFKEHT
ncbi:hypothetical protein QFX18_11545 [Saccharophagus degradans]|uniref:hypothetical protein n=1 Tax=Saccharophagus degradans TaxID=86304 RepID=UPI0024780A7F|nr:hypothetical protein [Saccharophagus degradans]WGO96680.1 hypothetical protein QFX18_11545 [Saccharophagus degradans]